MDADEDIKRLCDTIRANYPRTNLDIVRRAYVFAAHAHAGQLRENGDPYISHPYATGLQLAEWKMTPIMVAAGLLHDVPEDTSYTIANLEKEFGQDLASIVEGETKISKLRYRGRERYAENLRKMFIAIAKDVRVVIVKFADRHHNLLTGDALPPHRKTRMATETLEIYVPIANRLGMWAIRGELEDMAFKYAYSQEYEWTFRLAAERIPPKETYLEDVKKSVREELHKTNIPFISIQGRVKRLYSLYNKLLEKNRDISKVYDLIALRIIVPTVHDCYATLGILHGRWTPLKGRIKDYIAQPKPNGYQSLHTTVFCQDGEIVEFQIRTPEMEEEAEYGIAAYWHYIEQGKRSEKFDQHVKWLKELTEIQKNLNDREKFLEALESLKLDFFHDRIFVFTPKGDVIDLPENATPVDFAYAIHTEVGNKCSRAFVNNAISPLDTALESGDVVQIITDHNRKGPSSDWLKSVKTSHAKEKLKESIRHARLGNWVKEFIGRREK